ncbi:hypothetical protein BpHYR1_034974 [Brachionus plicatilis]|uniref:Uncharacterized protein n=1 Tax=Brachionus plicatilis TaxID=10195 RepID=A0A3M7S4H2_BRAPC|nr:hypothetical protein BpHYR1_034974 [Brachionus plicatilis]
MDQRLYLFSFPKNISNEYVTNYFLKNSHYQKNKIKIEIRCLRRLIKPAEITINYAHNDTLLISVQYKIPSTQLQKSN